jgi:hypothetical protein
MGKNPKIFQYQDSVSLPEGCYEIIDGKKKSMSPTDFYMDGLKWVYQNS